MTHYCLTVGGDACLLPASFFQHVILSMFLTFVLFFLFPDWVRLVPGYSVPYTTCRHVRGYNRDAYLHDFHPFILFTCCCCYPTLPIPHPTPWPCHTHTPPAFYTVLPHRPSARPTSPLVIIPDRGTFRLPPPPPTARTTPPYAFTTPAPFPGLRIRLDAVYTLCWSVGQHDLPGLICGSAAYAQLRRTRSTRTPPPPRFGAPTYRDTHTLPCLLFACLTRRRFGRFFHLTLLDEPLLFIFNNFHTRFRLDPVHVPFGRGSPYYS